jgi:hypothetical protein
VKSCLHSFFLIFTAVYCSQEEKNSASLYGVPKDFEKKNSLWIKKKIIMDYKNRYGYIYKKLFICMFSIL